MGGESFGSHYQLARNDAVLHARWTEDGMRAQHALSYCPCCVRWSSPTMVPPLVHHWCVADIHRVVTLTCWCCTTHACSTQDTWHVHGCMQFAHEEPTRSQLDVVARWIESLKTAWLERVKSVQKKPKYSGDVTVHNERELDLLLSRLIPPLPHCRSILRRGKSLTSWLRRARNTSAS